MGRLVIEIPSSEKVDSAQETATEAKTTADTVQEQMNALTSAFETEVAESA
ncbi:hypothetical protein [Collinsella sp. UBA1693]|uniref:hypothetical protein n=1 Tax=Collinsella sp. UBA1693 TaxID=1946385 RepID=UPI002580E5B9|nr:hypothetical protein [Collinsella sp. UBA1693]